MNSTRIFKSLADETRLRLLHLLLHHELNVNELVGILDMGQSRISRHLKILTDSGLLSFRRDGSYIYYSGIRSPELKHLTGFVIESGKSSPEFAADLDKAAEILEERKHKVRTFFNDLANDWDRMKQEILGEFSLAGIVSKRAENRDVAADLGCGTGGMIIRLARHCGRVIGVDSSPRMLEKAGKSLQVAGVEADLRLGELEHLPMRNKEVDLAVMEMVLRHVAEPQEGLKEVFRVLRPQGLFIMADFDRHDQEAVRRKYGGVWAGFTREQLESWMKEAGLFVFSIEQHQVRHGLSVNVCMASRV